MKFAIYARSIQNSSIPVIKQFFHLLEQYNIEYYVYDNFLKKKKKTEVADFETVKPFSKGDSLAKLNVDFMVSLGGDGTLLDTLTLVKDSGVPVMGINTGRLGFLANIPEEQIKLALEDLFYGKFTTESRTLLQLKANKTVFNNEDFALNDFTIHKRDNSSMVTVETYLNEEYFNTYWADGVIVATPTGSTGYSLSCGGPIISPDSKNFIITPVAPHNLNIRPIVISDESQVQFKVTGRGSNYLISLDSRYEVLDYSYEMTIEKAPFALNLLKLNRQSFIQTLREKLKWGIDSRNE